MTPEELARLSDAINALNETITSLNNGIAELNIIAPKFGGALRGIHPDLAKYGDLTRRANESLEEYNKRLEEVTELAIAEAEAREQELEAIENLTNAKYSLRTGFNQLKEALLSTERTLGKYSGALDQAGDAAIDFGKNFGIAGLAAGVVVKGFTALTSAGLKQADAQLKATDALAKVGATGTLTTDQILDMGHAAGLTSKNLELFTKPLQSMGPALITLGGSSKAATEEFAKMTAIRKEERQAFQRLGISQEELIQNQADYIKLQRASGVQITDNMKKDGALRRASLEYTENLLKLSAITGKNIDEVKKDQEIARAGYASLLQQNEIQRKIREAELAGNTDRANALRAELTARNQLLDAIKTQIDDPEMLAGVQQFLATGAITELSQSLLQLNIPIEQFSRRIKQGEDVTAEFMESFKQGVDRNNQFVGKSMALAGEQSGKIFGLTENTLKARAAMGERDEKEIRQRTAAEIAAGKKEGLDGIKDARATMTEAEIVLQQTVDKVVQVLNPLSIGFGFATAAAGALAFAAFAAARALGGLAASNAIGAGLSGPGGGIGGALGTLFKGGTALAKVGGIATGVLSVGSGIMTAMEGSKAADQAVAEGTMTKVQGEQSKEEAKYTGGGEAVGGVIGGALGMLAGPLGAAIGGTIGSKLGGFIGGWIARRDDEEELAKDTEVPVAQAGAPKPSGPPPTLSDIQDAAKLGDAQQQSTEALRVFNERLRNTQALANPAPAVAPTAQPATTPTAAPATPVETATGTQPAAVAAPQTPESATQPKPESPAQETQQQKTWFERNKNTITGMALGVLGGPLGIMAGGFIGRHLDTKLEEKDKDLATTTLAKKEEDKRAEEAEKLATSFKNLSSSIDVAARNVIMLDKSFDDFNFSMEEMVTQLSGEDEDRTPGEVMANDFRSAFMSAMIDLRRLSNRSSFSSDTGTAQAGAGGGAAGGGTRVEPPTAADIESGSVSQKGGVTLGEGAAAGYTGPPMPDFSEGRPGAEKPIAEVVDAGPGFTTVRTEDGSIQRREGARNWRNNNPGNLNFGSYAKSKDAVGSDGRFAVFPTLQDGMEAKRDLVFGSRYIDLSIAQAISKYAPPTENDTNMYIQRILEATGASSNTLLRELSGSQRESMLSAITKVEGFKPGKIIEGALGGIASGPKSGYPALLHGREAIVPLATNSLLEKMAKTPETQPMPTSANVTVAQQVDSPVLNRSLERLTELNAEMMSMMQEKFDEMIDKIGTGNDINRKIYKTAVV